jgi:glycogenin glucosyltransferase
MRMANYQLLKEYLLRRIGYFYQSLCVRFFSYSVQDPAVQLEQLARRQSDVLANKLGKDGTHPREIPLRPLPYGSEGVSSPTYVAQGPPSGATELGSTPRTTIEAPSYNGPGAMWEKDETFPSKETPAGATEEEKDVLET